MTSSPGAVTDDAADVFATIARDLLAEPGIDGTLDRVVHLTVETVPPCEEAGVLLVRRGRVQAVETPAATGADVRRAHDLQEELREGPCWDAIWENETLPVQDLRTEQRWPSWGPRVASELGFCSILAVRLYNTESTLGSLNLYSRLPDAFSRADEQMAQVLAAHAAVALTGAQEHVDLIHASETRLVIGQAEGILMERLGLTAEQAFELLRRASNLRNVKLREVARELVGTRQTPRRR